MVCVINSEAYSNAPYASSVASRKIRKNNHKKNKIGRLNVKYLFLPPFRFLNMSPIKLTKHIL